MSSFYGNVKSSPRSPFIFDKIYSSRTEMDAALTVQTDNNNAVQGDGVFINRYVLINYGFIQNGTYVLVNPKDVYPSDKNNLDNEEKNKTSDQYLVNANNYMNYFYLSPDGYSPISSNIFNNCTREQLNKYNPQIYRKTQIVNKYELAVYQNTLSPNEFISGNKIHEAFEKNLKNDVTNYNADYHLTVWMKIYMDNEEKYIMVAKLNPEAPALELRETSPAEGAAEGQSGPHWDLIQSSDINWVYDVPKHWDILLNTQGIADSNELANGEIQNITDDNPALPYFNAAGFDDKISNNTDAFENKIWFAPFKSETEYPIFEFKQIELTPDTYIKNKYYIGDGAEKTLCQGEWTSGTNYYIKTQKIENNERQYDQKRLSISLPSIGNAVSDLYDSIYGKPNSPKYLLGYTDRTTANNYENEENEEYFIPVKIDDPETGENKYLNQIEIDVLYHDNTKPHDIPVYDTTGKRRPYTSKQLYNAIGIEPYNNIMPNDPISMAWGVEEIKKYISELRFLSHGGPGYRIIGYTREDNINSYSNVESSNKHCLIVDNNYWLTPEQINALKLYNEEPGYVIPVYEYIESIGLQSDWCLDDTNAFGYIYHRPRILWSNSENINATNNNTDYFAQHTIEYIYDNYDQNTENLFGLSRSEQPNSDKKAWIYEKI